MSHPGSRRLRRSAAPVLLTLALVAGCTTEPSSDTRSSAPTTDARPTTTTTTLPSVPAAPPWAPTAGEPTPNAKTVAAGAVQVLTTYPFGEGTVEATRTRLVAAGLPPGLADAAGPLLQPGAASAGEIVYPQLGGLTASAASVMVVVRQRLADTEGERSVTRTLDVRLRLVGAAWAVEALASVGGDPVERTDATPAPVAELLDNDRVDLPDSARWDLLRGGTDPRVVDLLLRLAAERRLSVTVLASGHPVNVFETSRQSNHTAGRGVDIWAVDGVPVADQRGPDSPLRDLVARLAAEGVTEIGSPFDLDGAGRTQFTNTVHLDHLHLAYRR